MNRITAAVAAVTLAAMTLVSLAPQAEARHGGWGGGFVAAAIIGGVAAAIIASRHRHRSYGYGYAPTYYRPAYAYGGYRHHHWRRW